MTSRIVLLIFAAVVAVITAALFVIQSPSVQTEAALPGAQDSAALAPHPPCMGLTGRALEECRLTARYAAESHNYENAPQGSDIDASANAARAARGTGVEGMSSAGTTHAPRR